MPCVLILMIFQVSASFLAQNALNRADALGVNRDALVAIMSWQSLIGRGYFIQIEAIAWPLEPALWLHFFGDEASNVAKRGWFCV